MAAKKSTSAKVIASATSEEAKQLLQAIFDGKLDAGNDLALVEANARARIKWLARSSFPIGSRVRLRGTRNPKLEGKLGEVVKFNPTRVVVFLDDDWSEWMGPRGEVSLADKASYASVAAPASMLEEER